MNDQPNPATTSSPEPTTATATPPPAAVSTTPNATTAVAGQATIGQRAGAYVIDAVIATVAAGILATMVGQISSMLGFLFNFVGIAYILVRDSLPFLDGQSLGKKMLGLRAVTTDGQSLSGNWQPGLIRNAILVIPVMALVELIILFTKQDAPEGLLRLGDQWAGTKVIQVGK